MFGRFAVLAALLCVMGLWGPAAATDSGQPPSQTIVVPEQPPVAPAVSAAKVSKRIGFLERRRLGVTFRNVARVVQEMDAAGELDREYPDGIAVQVMQRLIDEKPAEFQAVMADRDWAAFFDALLAFLEKILPIILNFF